MNLDSIKEKVSEIFHSTPPEIGFGFGFKIKDNVLTDEVGFTYIVPKKKSVEELSEDEIFPKIIIHDGVEYTTDVIEIPEVVPFGQFCYGTDPAGSTQISSNCFSFTASTTVLNRNYTRPLKGGVSLGMTDGLVACTVPGTLTTTQTGSGTLGFIAVDNDTNALVGVTNNHVVITGLNDAFFTGDRDLFSTAIYNEAFPLRSVRQPGGSDGSFIQPYSIGRTIRYQPLVKVTTGNLPSTNRVDGALVSLAQSDSSGNPIIDNNESWKQLGLSQITTPPTFANISELNSMIGGGISSSNTQIISSGRSTGPKQGACSIRLHLLTVSTNVKYNYQGSAPCNVTGTGGELAPFVDQMSVCRVSSGNTLCSYPAAPGDSGSAMFAQFGGQWKIIGILFAGGSVNPQTGQVSLGGTQPPCLPNVPGCSEFEIPPFTYYAPPLFAFVNKITNLESALNISAWDGTPKPLIDPNSIQYVSVCGGSFDKTLTCSGDTYWQMGLTNSLIAPCNP